MEPRLTLLGHPLHPMLMVLPLGLLSMGVLFDAIYLVGGGFLFAEVAFWDITAGLAGGLLAGVAGLVDWLGIPSGTRARAVATLHGTSNALILLLFAASWWLRHEEHAYAPDVLPFALGMLGIALAFGSAWLGAELVYRHGIGVDGAASLDATGTFEDDEQSWRIPRPG